MKNVDISIEKTGDNTIFLNIKQKTKKIHIEIYDINDCYIRTINNNNAYSGDIEYIWKIAEEFLL